MIVTLPPDGKLLEVPAHLDVDFYAGGPKSPIAEAREGDLVFMGPTRLPGYVGRVQVRELPGRAGRPRASC